MTAGATLWTQKMLFSEHRRDDDDDDDDGQRRRRQVRSVSHATGTHQSGRPNVGQTVRTARPAQWRTQSRRHGDISREIYAINVKLTRH